MVFHVNGGCFQLKPNTFAISAVRKLAVFYAGNFMLPRVLWVMGHNVNPGLRNFGTRRIKHWQTPSDQLSMTGFRGPVQFPGQICTIFVQPLKLRYEVTRY